MYQPIITRHKPGMKPSEMSGRVAAQRQAAAQKRRQALHDKRAQAARQHNAQVQAVSAAREDYVVAARRLYGEALETAGQRRSSSRASSYAVRHNKRVQEVRARQKALRAAGGAEPPAPGGAGGAQAGAMPPLPPQ